MEINIIKNKLFNGLNLTIEESSKIFELIMSGQTSEIDTTAILIGLKIKKESSMSVALDILLNSSEISEYVLEFSDCII